MKLLATGDLHLGLTRYGRAGSDGVNSRIRDFEATLARFADKAIERDVDLTIIAGDTFHSRREGPHERAALVRAIERLRAHAIVTVIVDGNHDGRSVLGDPESASLQWLAGIDWDNVFVFLEPTSTFVETKAGPVGIVAYPYPHKRMLDAELAALEPTERALIAGERVERHIAELAADWDARLRVLSTEPPRNTLASAIVAAPLIFVGHLTVANSIAGSETAMKLGWDVAIHRDTLKRFDLAVLGHIHRFQRVADKAFYVGSPEYIDFTEAGLEKAFLYADVEKGFTGAFGVSTGVRPMVSLDAMFFEGKVTIEAPVGIMDEGPILRVVIRADEHPGAALLAKVRRDLIAAGATVVKVELVLPETTIRERATGPLDETLDMYEATRRHLVAREFPLLEAAMVAARKLLAA